MPTKEKKDKALSEVREKMGKAVSFVLADYRGLDVSAMTDLRRRLRQADCELKVAKNTLLSIVAGEMNLQDMEKYLEGPTAIAFGYQNIVDPAKVLIEFARENKKLEIKGGVVEGKVFDLQGVRILASLPPREVLLGRVVSGIQSPLYGLVGAMQGLLRNFVYALDAVRRQKEESPAA